MKPISNGEKTEHVTKVGEEIDRQKEETPISIITSDNVPSVNTETVIISEQVNAGKKLFQPFTHEYTSKTVISAELTCCLILNIILNRWRK